MGTFYLDRLGNELYRNRMLSLMVGITAVGLLSSPLFSLQAGRRPVVVLGLLNEIFLHSTGLTFDHFYQSQVVLFGLLLVVNEANFLLRYLLDVLGLKPLGNNNQGVDQEEYNTGRIIGLLERIFIFLFVLMNQYAAIGFILTAKGVTRFQDFKDRTFAEYVFIGTLLSTLLAMTVALLVAVVLGRS